MCLARQCLFTLADYHALRCCRPPGMLLLLLTPAQPHLLVQAQSPPDPGYIPDAPTLRQSTKQGTEDAELMRLYSEQVWAPLCLQPCHAVQPSSS